MARQFRTPPAFPVVATLTSMDPARQVALVLFDLGGVLIDVGGVAPMRDLAGVDSDEALWQRWLTSPWVRSFERGQCTAHEFAAGMVQEWNLDLTPAEYLVAFSSWMSGPVAGAAELVAHVQRSVAVGCLSNMNHLHWETIATESPIFEHLDHRFLSFEIGLVKPDAEIFEFVARNLDVARESILFLDDNQVNVRAAQEAGFTAQRVQGLGEARHALRAVGLVTTSA